jgi:polyhydroxybutyrate depolymerase
VVRGIRAALPLLVALAIGPAFVGAARADTVERTIEVDGRIRSYLIHVPRAPEGTRFPVVFAFQGAGSDPESMVRATGLDAAADRRLFLVVYPRAMRPMLRYDVDAADSNDLRFVGALLDRLRKRFAVDERRIFATGFSNGGAFCYRVAAAMPRTFAAVAPVAGYLPAGLREPPARPVALLHIHGTRDDRVPLAPGSRGVFAGIATWASWCGCSGEPVLSDVPEARPLRARRWDYACPEGSRVGVILFEGAGHEWPGGPSGPLTPILLRFFGIEEPVSTR